MNRCILFGFTGNDPKVTTMQSGLKVAKFSLATNKSYTNKSGEKITETQWHNIIFWNRQAELCEKYVKKGSSLIVEGEVTYRSYENRDGVTVYVTEIIGNNLHFAGSKKEDEPQAKSEWQGKKPVKSMSNVDELPGAIADDLDALANLPE